MRIDKINSVIAYNSVSNNKGAQKPADEKATYSIDRVEVGSKPSVDQMKSTIKDNVVKFERQQTRSERLESIKQRISENRYYVNTDDIVKSMLYQSRVEG